MLTAHKYIDCCCNPSNKYWEQTISSNVCFVPLRVIFVFVFILQRSLINSGLLFPALIELGMFVLSAKLAKLYLPKKIVITNSQQHLLFQQCLYSC